MDKTGAQFLKPWDTYLDADTNTTMQDNLLLLASGDMSVDDFCKLIDDSIATNAKKLRMFDVWEKTLPDILYLKPWRTIWA